MEPSPLSSQTSRGAQVWNAGMGTVAGQVALWSSALWFYIVDSILASGSSSPSVLSSPHEGQPGEDDGSDPHPQ